MKGLNRNSHGYRVMLSRNSKIHFRIRMKYKKVDILYVLSCIKLAYLNTKNSHFALIVCWF